MLYDEATVVSDVVKRHCSIQGYNFDVYVREMLVFVSVLGKRLVHCARFNLCSSSGRYLAVQPRVLTNGCCGFIYSMRMLEFGLLFYEHCTRMADKLKILAHLLTCSDYLE